MGCCVENKICVWIGLRKGRRRDISYKLVCTDSGKILWWLSWGGNSRSRGTGQILDILERKPTEYVDRLGVCYRRNKKNRGFHQGLWHKPLERKMES